MTTWKEQRGLRLCGCEGNGKGQWVVYMVEVKTLGGGTYEGNLLHNKKA